MSGKNIGWFENSMSQDKSWNDGKILNSKIVPLRNFRRFLRFDLIEFCQVRLFKLTYLALLLTGHTIFVWLKTGTFQNNEPYQINVVHILLGVWSYFGFL